ncbi:MAG: UDP-N-acetylmuramoyl-L-alanyl-D-glutamate--2,6-diaminopimelate ligase [Bacteroidales bacterium]|nr:UDP-N-acetylmuramoyl-L-alanyl-D-glutamate--2,6-diaminopimelate ligase [Bacteroidales bacterium]
MILSDLLKQTETIEIKGDTGVFVSDICTDSRNASDKSMFVAVNGTLTNGHLFIDKAIAGGATSIVCEVFPDVISSNVTYIKIADTKKQLGYILSAFYNNPSSKIKIIGVTGTNGKTSTVTLLHRLFSICGMKSALLSTVINIIDQETIEATHTTPDAVQLYQLLNKMVEAECEYCFMEVSSHALEQDRVAGIDFAGAIFTNITHDHLDYHKTFDNYIKAKQKLFNNLSKDAFALTNNDDKNGLIITQNTKAEVHTYSLKSFSDFKCKIIESHFEGMLLHIDNTEMWTKFTGQFNAYNLLAVYSASQLLGLEKETAMAMISNMNAVNGRFQVMRSESGINAIVDYAHTPDALLNVLNTINDIKNDKQKVISVVGAGDDRDKTKRPIMGRIAAQKSDKIILTSDNPRSEDPTVIADEMKAGVEITDLKKVLTIIDRKEAIRTALHLAKPGDVVLIAGKGHEDYQIIKGVKSHFDDKEVIKEIFKEL